MMKVAIISGQDTIQLQENINHWIQSHWNIEVIDVKPMQKGLMWHAMIVYKVLM